MLSELEIENFKPFGRPQIAELAPITLIYGPNSSGKSSILQSLLLIRQSLATAQDGPFRLVPQGQYTNLGTFKALLHQHDLHRIFRLRMRYRLTHNWRVDRTWDEFDRGTTLEFAAANSVAGAELGASELSSIEYQFHKGTDVRCRFNRSKYQFANESVLYDWADDESAFAVASLCLERLEQLDNVSPGQIGPKRGLEELAEINKAYFAVCRGSLPSAVRPKRDAGDPRESLLPFYDQFVLAPCLDSLRYEFGRFMALILHLGPLRLAPERRYSISGGHRLSVGIQGENTAHMIYHADPGMTDLLNQWLRILGLPYKLKANSKWDELDGDAVSLNLIHANSGIFVGPSDVGFGISQLLPILVQGVTSAGRTLCVEQPELHLHPRLQANLADFFIETAGVHVEDSPRTARGNQWIIETHSEALMLRFQRRIREGTLDPASILVLYVNPNDEGGSDILRLRLDERGEFIDSWPDGFFEEGYREIFGLGR